VFGSSANNFGNDCADLDMCMSFPKGTPPPQNAGETIARLAERLEALGMTEVSPRPTARIPIVLFQDPETGLDCDISMENPLAIRNTQLLKVYSRVDPRVRALAYVVKHWARRRCINSPSEGTLSSYAYILMVLHFLQTRRPPIVPNLQVLPPDWAGQDLDFRQVSSLMPVMMVQHPIDRVEVNTYFYVPASGDYRLLQQYATRNKAPVGQLLADFFRYFAFELDPRESVVSVRTGGVLQKDEKGEVECWPCTSRLAIEDPFETWYNVTHFVRETRQHHVRMEFARAYSLICREGRRVATGGAPTGGLLAMICEEAPPPSFLQEKKDAGEEEEARPVEAEAGAGGV
jgi:terminal uridylyltransferase